MENLKFIINWAKETLLSKGYILIREPEPIQTTPYSSVIHFISSNGDIYLKQTPPALFLEPMTIQILHEQFQANVPIVIAVNKPLNCFLMKGCGNPLRENLKNNFQVKLLCQGIKKYTDIQYAVANHTNLFLDLGVPDWRLEKLPFLYQELISRKDLLTQDGISAEELQSLQDLPPLFLSICEIVSQYKITETLDHCDFHDNNILIESGSENLTIIDWGETVIAHPFFPLISFLSTTAYRYGLKETDENFIEIQEACFKNWQGTHQKNELLTAMRITKKLWPIYSALGYYRLIESSNLNPNVEALQSYFISGRNKGRLAGYLKEFIRTTAHLDPTDTSRVNLSDPARHIHG